MKIRKALTGLTVAMLAAMGMLAVGAASANAAQKLCKENEAVCKAENRYLAGTSVKGEATNTKFTLEPIIGGMPKFIEIKCTGAVLQMKTEENEGAVELEVDMETMSFTGCSSAQAETCSVTQVNIALAGGFIGSATGNGTLETNGELKIECKNPNFVCVYKSQGALAALGGNPGAIEAAAQIARLPNQPGNCPSLTNWSGKYTLSAPAGKIFFTN